VTSIVFLDDPPHYSRLSSYFKICNLGNRAKPDQTLFRTGSDRGLRISTWADVPRGSGLGTSSILAAALVRALLRLRGEPDSNEEVSHKVLVLEQLMGTGGGWQDQVKSGSFASYVVAIRAVLVLDLISRKVRDGAEKEDSTGRW
jgi:galactokinase